MTRVLVVSTHRSDKGHYDRLLRVLRADPRIDCYLYAVNDFYARPSYIDAVRPLSVLEGKNAPKSLDAAVVLGDRYEMMLAAMQLVEARVPLLHIHGGEHTYGSLDERWRWAMSLMADMHCVAHEQAKNQIMSAMSAHVLPEENIHVTGAPGLDDITERQMFSDPPSIVVLYNPIVDSESSRTEIRAIRESMLGAGVYMWMKPNGDRFSDMIVQEFGGSYMPNPDELDAAKFRDLLAAAHVIVGNSSAGIIEAPSLGTWAVNVGERQAGRLRAGNVIDVPADPVKIREAIEFALAQPRWVGVNPYRHPEGRACEAIRDVLLGMA